EPSKDVLRMRHLKDGDQRHTFHLPHDECTIILEDVSLQIGVNVNDLPIIGPTYFDWNELCEELLGKVHTDEQDMRDATNLYREMCRATKPNAKAMSGYLTLL
ncbi:hypothetical protein Lal_00018895, partial [Lupinus albus]